jgi:WD40 repeat protein
MSLAFCKDGKRLASGSRDGEVKLWEFPSGRELLAFKGHSGAVTAVAFHPDGRQLATASYDHTVRLWDVNTARENRR